MPNRPQYIALAIVTLLVVMLLSLPSRASAGLKMLVGTVFIPFFGVAASAQQLVQQTQNSLIPRQALLNQVEQLRRENQQLRLQLAEAGEWQRENDRLRSQLGFQKQAPWKLRLVPVVAREPANWWRALHLGAGRSEGLQNDLAVVAPEGLVGRVAAVEFGRSLVVLLGDPNCRVSALVKETRDLGVIAPSASAVLDPSLVDLIYLPRQSTVKPGHTVMTSGLGGIFPKGIPIGTVVDIRPGENDLYLEARVRLAARLSHLEEAWVILP